MVIYLEQVICISSSWRHCHPINHLLLH